jgi:hypothetical protein
MIPRNSWMPQESIVIAFDDCTAETRSPEQIDMFFNELREVAGKYGFDIHTWGSNSAMLTWLEKLGQETAL